MNLDAPYSILAFYHLAPLSDPLSEVAIHKEYFKNRDVACRIYISEKGINGQMSARKIDAEAYIEWMSSRNQFNGIAFKTDPYHEHVFPRKTVKYRKHLVAYDEEVDLSVRGEHLSPDKWKKMLDESVSHILIDVRNDYEWSVGHFEGAERPPCETFKDFRQYTEQLKASVDPQQTPVMMYCTGGIRCELYSAILLKGGFEKVYQLEGGVINYGQKQGADHWLGKLFVFDDRLAVPISKAETPVIGKCHHCKAPIDNFYNCANMDCNHLFICCADCLKRFSGCCKESCTNAKRLRPYHQQNPHKPFRKWYHYWKEKAGMGSSQ